LGIDAHSGVGITRRIGGPDEPQIVDLSDLVPNRPSSRSGRPIQADLQDREVPSLLAATGRAGRLGGADELFVVKDVDAAKRVLDKAIAA
jgi:hypothetical protein